MSALALPKRLRAATVAMLKRWGPERVRNKLWNAEFSAGQYAHIESTGEDYIYGVLERYLNGGSILDLGCGSGNTGVELSRSAYSNYVGIDVSSIAVEMARRRSNEAGRASNTYAVADIGAYVPTNIFDVILFRESLYYIPIGRVPSVLSRYASFLKKNGVFVVRIWDQNKHRELVDTVSNGSCVVERVPHDLSAALVLVLRPKGVS
jgi:SAM-dependent methyltransferase